MSAAVLFLDLDNFKVVNDSLGHKVGDQLLVDAAQRIQSCLRPEDTAARLGGDEFTVLLEDVAEPGDAIRVAERILEQLAAPFKLDRQEVFSSPSIGIALSSPGHDGPEALVRNADVAMYQAKVNGKARYQLLEPSMNARAKERLELETDLHRAIERGELRVLLPAHRVPQDRSDYRDGGAGAMGAARTRDGLPRRVHPARRRCGADCADRAVGVGGGVSAGAALATAIPQ
jgi:diguanylate cyclase (GGDEF)-like protein